MNAGVLASRGKTELGVEATRSIAIVYGGPNDRGSITLTCGNTGFWDVTPSEMLCVHYRYVGT
jgi:hypothetical protein